MPWVRVPLPTPFFLFGVSDGVSPRGKARDFDSRIRRFDPCHPSQLDPLAQLAEHLTFNQGVRGSNPRWVTIPGCVSRGRGGMADAPDLGSGALRRMSSSLFARTTQAACGSSSVGRAPPCQGGGRESEPRLPLHNLAGVAQWQSSSLPSWSRGFDSHHPLQQPYAPLAQLVEHLTLNQGVPGSSP